MDKFPAYVAAQQRAIALTVDPLNLDEFESEWLFMVNMARALIKYRQVYVEYDNEPGV